MGAKRHCFDSRIHAAFCGRRPHKLFRDERMLASFKCCAVGDRNLQDAIQYSDPVEAEQVEDMSA